ncbi:MAG: hypothetical protein ACRD5K_18820 [Candidatus Acidiferrales bacterium]
MRSEFSTGVAYLHSFQYSQATKAFSDIAARDPKCAMAYWGQAMSLYQQIWNFPNAAILTKGHDYIEKAQDLRAKTKREREYIAALATFYQLNPKLSQIERTEDYSKAIAEVYADNPSDANAGAWYALSLVALAQDGVNDLDDRKHAISILQKLFAEHPDNPGVDHYLIHAADTPQLAPEALAAARNYAKIAPDSAHALHMPSHIFTRLGYWQDSIDSNLASAAAAEKATRSGSDDESGYQVHAMTYLEYAYLQRGEDQKAREVIAQLRDVQGDDALDLEEEQALFRITYDMETHDWKAASQIAMPPKDAYPSDMQSLYWARTIAVVRMGDAATARQNLVRLQRVFASVPEARWKQKYLTPADLTEAESWTDFAEGNSSLAKKMMRQAVATEGSRDSDDLTFPATEMLADLLLASHEPALGAYENALKANPNRFDSLYGAAMAALAEGKRAKAYSYAEQLEKSCAADEDRPEIRVSRTLLSERAPR